MALLSIPARWPLYVFEILFSLAAIGLTLLVWRRRGRGWNENIVIVPWLLGTAAFAVSLLIQVAALGWRDIPPLARNAMGSNILAVAGPASVIVIMVLRLWKRG